jgi:hypothetical protein
MTHRSPECIWGAGGRGRGLTSHMRSQYYARAIGWCTAVAAVRPQHNAPKTGLDAPLRIPEPARARPSLRCAPFKYSWWCMGRIRCVTIYSFFGAEEVDLGLAEISNADIRF